jgi:hypothetical protein
MKQIGGILLAVIVAGCTGGTTAPTPTPAVSPPVVAVPVPVTEVISGVVAEGSGPIPGAQVDNGYGPGAWVITDANGAFQLSTTKSVHPMRWVRASKPGYVQPCAAPINGDAPLNVQIVSRSALTGAPLPSPTGLRTVSGVVMQMMDSGAPQPVANVWVDFEPSADGIDDWPAAVTLSDAMGRFSLCGLPMEALPIGATSASGSYHALVTVPPGQNEIEVMLHH